MLMMIDRVYPTNQLSRRRRGILLRLSPLTIIAIHLTTSTKVSAAYSMIPDANMALYLQDLLCSVSSKSRLANKRIWIVGSSRGIGEELATQLYTQHGVRLILSSRNLMELQRVQQKCIQQKCLKNDLPISVNRNNDHDESLGVHVLPFDITSTNDIIAKTVREALGCFKGIDILILNSGIGQLSSVSRQVSTSQSIQESMDTAHQLMSLNFYGPLQLTMEVLRQGSWSTDKKGHIVVTSSIAGIMPLPLSSSYAASKHALHGYFASLRCEYSPWLRVDLLCPGPVGTSFQNHVVDRTTTKSHMHTLETNHNVKRESSVMTVERCAQLMISAMEGNPSIFFHESWIATQPTLSFLYLYQYFPTFSTWILGFLGKWRTKAFEMGLPLYKASSWLQAAKAEGRNQSSMTKSK